MWVGVCVCVYGWMCVGIDSLMDFVQKPHKMMRMQKLINYSLEHLLHCL